MIYDSEDVFKNVLYFCANTHDGVTDFEFDVMVRNTQDQISPERNMALPPT